VRLADRGDAGVAEDQQVKPDVRVEDQAQHGCELTNGRREPEPAPCTAGGNICAGSSHEDMMGLPVLRYEGAVRLVATPEDLAAAMADIRSEKRRVLRYGDASRVQEGARATLPCLAQVATARAVYLFQLQQQDFAAPMAEMLASARIVKAGVSVADDLRNLKKLFPFDEKRGRGRRQRREAPRPEADRRAQPRRDLPRLQDSEGNQDLQLGRAAAFGAADHLLPRRTPGRAASSILF